MPEDSRPSDRRAERDALAADIERWLKSTAPRGPVADHAAAAWSEADPATIARNLVAPAIGEPKTFDFAALGDALAPLVAIGRRRIDDPNWEMRDAVEQAGVVAHEVLGPYRQWGAAALLWMFVYGALTLRTADPDHALTQDEKENWVVAGAKLAESGLLANLFEAIEPAEALFESAITVAETLDADEIARKIRFMRALRFTDRRELGPDVQLHWAREAFGLADEPEEKARTLLFLAAQLRQLGRHGEARELLDTHRDSIDATPAGSALAAMIASIDSRGGRRRFGVDTEDNAFAAILRDGDENGTVAGVSIVEALGGFEALFEDTDLAAIFRPVALTALTASSAEDPRFDQLLAAIHDRDWSGLTEDARDEITATVNRRRARLGDRDALEALIARYDARADGASAVERISLLEDVILHLYRERSDAGRQRFLVYAEAAIDALNTLVLSTADPFEWRARRSDNDQTVALLTMGLLSAIDIDTAPPLRKTAAGLATRISLLKSTAPFHQARASAPETRILLDTAMKDAVTAPDEASSDAILRRALEQAEARRIFAANDGPSIDEGLAARSADRIDPATWGGFLTISEISIGRLIPLGLCPQNMVCVASTEEVRHA